MKYVVVVPYTYRPYFDQFMATCQFPRENMLCIDNTTPEKNIGCMASHNKGVEFMYEKGADWLIVISPAIRFGDKGGLDFIQQIRMHDDHHVIHGASDNVVGGKQSEPGGGGVNKVFGWHLVAFSKKVFDAIGNWDENFTPYGFDDLDLSIRIRKHFATTCKWDTFPCDVTDTRMSHSLHFVPEVVGEAHSTPRAHYFARKWKRAHGDWQVEPCATPFDDPTKPLSYWPKPDDPLSIQQNELKGVQ